MPNQQMPLFVSRAPRVTDADVQWMLRFLDGRKWVTAVDIKYTAPIMCRGDRHLRAIAAASQGQIISGQKGYARTDQASVEDVRHAADWLRHQAAAMTKRAAEIERAMHKRVAA